MEVKWVWKDETLDDITALFVSEDKSADKNSILFNNICFPLSGTMVLIVDWYFKTWHNVSYRRS